MEEVLSSSEVSVGDEEKGTKLSLSLALVQKEMIKLAREVKRAEARMQHAEIKYQDAEKRASKWEKLYRQLKDSQAAIKEEGETGSESEVEVEERKPAASTPRAKRKSSDANGINNKRSRGESKNDKQEPSTEESDGDASDGGESDEHFNGLDEATREWIDAIGLKDAYGTRNEGLDRLNNVGTYVAPPSFERVFLLTDYLFPVEEGEDTYHKRLFKSDSRPGIKVRAKLRKIKKNTPDDPLVCWHKAKQPWIPPNTDALAGMVRLIVDT